jgi:hypothetical protein
MTTRVGACDLPYWGMSWGAHPETFLLGSRSSLSLYDRRVRFESTEPCFITNGFPDLGCCLYDADQV